MTGLSQALCFPSDGAAGVVELKVVNNVLKRYSRGTLGANSENDHQSEQYL